MQHSSLDLQAHRGGIGLVTESTLEDCYGQSTYRSARFTLAPRKDTFCTVVYKKPPRHKN